MTHKRGAEASMAVTLRYSMLGYLAHASNPAILPCGFSEQKDIQSVHLLCFVQLDALLTRLQLNDISHACLCAK